MKLDDIKTPVSAVTGVGPQLTKTLAKINVFTVADLLKYFPRDFEDRSKKIFLKDFAAAPNHTIHTVAQVLNQEWFGYGKMRTLKITINDGTASAQLICFNRAFLEKTLVPGTIITVTGQFFVKYNTLQSTAFEVEVHKNLTPLVEPVETSYKDISENLMRFRQAQPTGSMVTTGSTNGLTNIPPLHTGILPVYPLTTGLTQKTISKAISTAITQYLHGIENELPLGVIENRNLFSKQDAIRFIHKPDTLEQAQKARKTLAYEELFHFQEIVLQRAFRHRGTFDNFQTVSQPQIQQNQTPQENNTDTESQNIPDLSPLQQQFLESLPFPLTPDQKFVITQINQDIDKAFREKSRILNQLDRGIPSPNHPPFAMARLLQGDVGSGKTLVSIFAFLRIISWKGQCALMAPTEILARQHAENIDKLLSPFGIRVAFLTGNVKSAGRTQIIKALKAGEIDVIVGTHALYSNQILYKNLELVVIDEQHRFGVMQRQAVIAKGRHTEHGITFEPNLLMMSATPIPQTLALTVFGDLDISTIKTMPQGRKPITTYLVKEGNEINAYEAVRKELEKGHQAYFVYPSIDSDQNIKSAERAFENLSQHIFPQYKCALLHSKVPEEDQIQILNQFHDGTIQVLAATTVVEVGVDVPNATCMVIEGADRFGMAQLHQLRGRVGRGSDQSFCFLIYSQNITQIGIERMKALRQSTDGFYIAEQDLRTRGPGEINGTLQAGALGFQIADLSRDNDLMLKAREDALFMLRRLQDGVRE